MPKVATAANRTETRLLYDSVSSGRQMSKIRTAFTETPRFQASCSMEPSSSGALPGGRQIVVDLITSTLRSPFWPILQGREGERCMVDSSAHAREIQRPSPHLRLF